MIASNQTKINNNDNLRHTLLFNCWLIVSEIFGGSLSVKVSHLQYIIISVTLSLLNYRSSVSYTLFHFHTLRTLHRETAVLFQMVYCNLLKQSVPTQIPVRCTTGLFQSFLHAILLFQMHSKQQISAMNDVLPLLQNYYNSRKLTIKMI